MRWSVRLPWPSDFQAGWPWVTETVESEPVDKGGYCCMTLVIYTQQPTFLHLLGKFIVVDKHLKVQTMSRLCFAWRATMSNRMDRMILSPMQLTGHMPKILSLCGLKYGPSSSFCLYAFSKLSLHYPHKQKKKQN